MNDRKRELFSQMYRISFEKPTTEVAFDDDLNKVGQVFEKLRTAQGILYAFKERISERHFTEVLDAESDSTEIIPVGDYPFYMERP